MVNRQESAEHPLEQPLKPGSAPHNGTCVQNSGAQWPPLEDGNIQFKEGDVVADRFRVIRFIAKGGMGEVYEVEDTRLQGVHLALKTILPHIASKPDMHERFEREVLLARRVTHTNLCPIYDIFHCRHGNAEITFLTMKLLPGETLAARIKRQGPIALEEATPIVMQVASALAAAHDAGILHRDIKAANIMLHGSGAQVQACVTDFGLARAYQTDSTVLSLDGVAGTPGYLAPELFHGAPPSTASDVYAFGVVVYDMLAGQLPPFRLESNAKATAKMTSDPTIAHLSANWKTLIARCLEPEPSRRYQSMSEALDSFHNRRRSESQFAVIAAPLSRRSAIGLGAAATVAAAGGMWFNWSRISFAMHPLPPKRFVALLAWPTGDSAAILATVLDSIGSRLARAEAHVKDLLIVSSSDLPDDTGPIKNPGESVTALGANLVLAASLQSTPATVTLTLQVLDAVTQRMLRKTRVSIAPQNLGGLAEGGSAAAAKLLGLPERETPVKDLEELHRVSPEVFRIFSEAEQLANEPNHTGLQGAVLKYQQALDADPHFALGYAKLALAYTQQFIQSGEAATLKLAANNAGLALRYNPRSAKGLLSQALVLLYSGKPDDAFNYFSKCLAADPGNPETLLYKAQAYRNVGKLPEASAVYREVLKQRPNYWLAHNELGYLLSREAKYQQAADEFDAAAHAAPQVALPLANLGTTYFQLGKHDEAIAACMLSLKKSPTEAAYMALGDIAFSDGKFTAALDNYQHAAALHPMYHLIWRDIGDCYAVLGQPALVRENYRKAAQLLSSSLAINPKGGPNWAVLAFYHAKIGDAAHAEADLKNVEAQGAKDVDSQFYVVQALALLGRNDEALKLLLTCMDRGLAPVDVNLALDLKSLQKDPRYLARVAELRAKDKAKVT